MTETYWIGTTSDGLLTGVWGRSKNTTFTSWWYLWALSQGLCAPLTERPDRQLYFDERTVRAINQEELDLLMAEDQARRALDGDTA